MEENKKIKEAEKIADLLTDKEILLVMRFMSEIKSNAGRASREEIEYSPLQASNPPRSTKHNSQFSLLTRTN